MQNVNKISKHSPDWEKVKNKILYLIYCDYEKKSLDRFTPFFIFLLSIINGVLIELQPVQL